MCAAEDSAAVDGSEVLLGPQVVTICILQSLLGLHTLSCMTRVVMAAKVGNLSSPSMCVYGSVWYPGRHVLLVFVQAVL